MRVLQRLGLSWTDVLEASLAAIVAAWAVVLQAKDIDSPGGKTIVQSEKFDIADAAGRAFGASLRVSLTDSK
jgi:hypothetical protein